MVNKTRTRTSIAHYPRLDTILMVENTIRKAKDYPNKAQLWKALSKKVMYQTFNVILEYLEDSNKILLTKDGKVIWVWNPERVKDLMSKNLIVR